jgi:hypothetical protein
MKKFFKSLFFLMLFSLQAHVVRSQSYLDQFFNHLTFSRCASVGVGSGLLYVIFNQFSAMAREERLKLSLQAMPEQADFISKNYNLCSLSDTFQSSDNKSITYSYSWPNFYSDYCKDLDLRSRLFGLWNEEVDYNRCSTVAIVIAIYAFWFALLADK